jgi:hypothetical protein
MFDKKFIKKPIHKIFFLIIKKLLKNLELNFKK